MARVAAGTGSDELDARELLCVLTGLTGNAWEGRTHHRRRRISHRQALHQCDRHPVGECPASRREGNRAHEELVAGKGEMKAEVVRPERMQ